MVELLTSMYVSFVVLTYPWLTGPAILFVYFLLMWEESNIFTDYYDTECHFLTIPLVSALIGALWPIFLVVLPFAGLFYIGCVLLYSFHSFTAKTIKQIRSNRKNG
jgi:hypothetical protein